MDLEPREVIGIPGKDKAEMGKPLRAGGCRIIRDRCRFCQQVFRAMVSERHGS